MTQLGRTGTAKLDRRVSYLEAKASGAVPMKVHMLGENETPEDARAAHGLGPNDLIIQIVGFSEVDEDGAFDGSHGTDQGGHDEAR